MGVGLAPGLGDTIGRCLGKWKAMSVPRIIVEI